MALGSALIFECWLLPGSSYSFVLPGVEMEVLSLAAMEGWPAGLHLVDLFRAYTWFMEGWALAGKNGELHILNLGSGSHEFACGLDRGDVFCFRQLEVFHCTLQGQFQVWVMVLPRLGRCIADLADLVSIFRSKYTVYCGCRELFFPEWVWSWLPNRIYLRVRTRQDSQKDANFCRVVEIDLQGVEEDARFVLVVVFATNTLQLIGVFDFHESVIRCFLTGLELVGLSLLVTHLCSPFTEDFFFFDRLSSKA